MSELKTEYTAFVSKLFNRSSDLSKDFTHAILGLATEVYELREQTDAVNALEEAGDLTFYVYALSQVIDDCLHADGKPVDRDASELQAREALAATLAGLDEVDPEVSVDLKIDQLLNDLLDEAKRWIGYGKAPANWGNSLSNARIVHALALASYTDSSLTTQRVIGANMAKLLKRYPGGEFDAYRAIVRDLEAERETLAAV